MKPSSSDACEVHGDGVADPEWALKKTPNGISHDRATATWIRGRTGVTVSTFVQPMAILPYARCRLSPENLQLLEKGASDDTLLGHAASAKQRMHGNSRRSRARARHTGYSSTYVEGDGDNLHTDGVGVMRMCWQQYVQLMLPIIYGTLLLLKRCTEVDVHARRVVSVVLVYSLVS